jgi:uncharacterized damage-inducible protein DinB
VTEFPAERLVPLDHLFADLDQEFAKTRRLLEHYPDGHADWRPHEKSMTLAGLAGHVASLPGLAHAIATDPEWNAAENPYVPPTAETRAELVTLFDATSTAAREAIRALGPAQLEEPWRMRNGEIIYFEGTRGTLLRRFLLSHTAHHRGQLTVYYRLLGAPVPGLYGPSADEMPG